MKNKKIYIALLVILLAVTSYLGFTRYLNNFVSRNLAFEKLDFRLYNQLTIEKNILDEKMLSLDQKWRLVQNDESYGKLTLELAGFIKNRDFRFYYLNGDAFKYVYLFEFPNLVHYEQKNLLLRLLETDQEKSIVVKNYAWISCDSEEQLKNDLKMVEGLKDKTYKYSILSKFKECYYSKKISDITFQKVLKLENDEIFDLNYFKRNLLNEYSNSLYHLPVKLIDKLVSSNRNFKEIIRNRYLIYLDELSQFKYIKNENDVGVKLMNEYLANKDPRNKNPYLLNQETMIKVRLAKIYIKTGRIDEALKILYALADDQRFLTSLPREYYPDFSVANLLLQKKYNKEVLIYLKKLHENKLLESDLYQAWSEQINLDTTPQMEIDIYKKRNEYIKDSSRYDNESSQIIQFEDQI